MKKIVLILTAALLCFMGSVIAKAYARKEAAKYDYEVKEIDPYVSERLLLKEDQLETWISTLSGGRISDLKISLEKDDQIGFSFTLDEKSLALLNLSDQSVIQSAAELFSGETVSCQISLGENNGFALEECRIGILPVPKDLYENKIEQLQPVISELLDKAGIEEISVFDETLEIQGDISKALTQLGQ